MMRSMKEPDLRQMKYSTRLVMVITPIGAVIGVMEAWRLAGGLVAVVAAQLLLMSLAAWALFRRIREERDK